MVLKGEYTKGPSATPSSNLPLCRSLSSSEDGPSGHSSLSDRELVRNLQDNIQHRILYLSEQLRVEKANRDENTMGYIKLVSKADRHQAPHIRQAFEKVNQRASATIAHIERKLHQCHQQLQELEEGCRPKEHSPDNCQQPSEKAPLSEPHKPGGEYCLSTNLSDIVSDSPLGSDFPALQQGKSSETKRVAQQRNLPLQKVKEELKEVEKLHLSLQMSYQSLKEKYLTDLQVLVESLQEEKCKPVLLEELVNVYLQGHLNEICHLKQHLACTEEKMVYLSYERAKEMWEVMETFKSRISKLETLQQATQLEMTESLRSRPQFLFRFGNLLLTLATILLVFIATVCTCPLLLVNSHLRICTILMLIGLGVLAWQKWHATLALHWQAWDPSG
ncbi:testis expressed 28 [Rhinolophus ferrumequinum]|uniref:Testis expressed 28 n=1 Tax=Rhinolophus ferrumequinum TaxID=59479 RepID=A0A7J8AWY8_RHIFE|nr:testis-specific protein TEX28 [Rhinolophus ferrumequinum]KAF6390944.1 testis expressed 28 [Rhinolophus ferrumequinum]